MKIIDTHAHLYLPEFDADRNDVVERAIQNGVSKIVLPNVDCDTIDDMFHLADQYPDNCFPTLGLHPCSVKNDFNNDLASIYKILLTKKVVAIGEIGLDFYWDISFVEEQIKALEIQISWAKEMHLPLIIHLRNSHDRVMEVIKKNYSPELCGVFHCFSGTLDQAKAIIDLGFYLGIGGVLTFKNSSLSQVLSHVPIEWIMLETDSPYLAPVPFRGKRNESVYLNLIVNKLSEVYAIEKENIIKITTHNASSLFAI